MDDTEFQDLLSRFKVVRTRDHRASNLRDGSSRASASAAASAASSAITAGGARRGNANEPGSAARAEPRFFDELSKLLRKQLGPREAEGMLQAFAKHHREVVDSLSKDELEQLAQAST